MANNLYLTTLPINHELVLTTTPQWNNRMWMHRTIMKLFGTYPNSRGTTLFRFEPTHQRFLIQSQDHPSPHHNLTTKNITPRLHNLTNGDTILIKTELNAIKENPRPAPNQPRYTPIPEENTKEWIINTLTKRGIAPHPETITYTTETAKGKNAPLYTITTQLTATITHHTHFTQAVYAGVGRSKAYGCGMISFLPTS